MFNWDYFIECLRGGLKYLPINIKLTFIVFVLSILIGLVVATVRFYRIPVFSQVFAAFVTIYMGFPVMVALNVYYLIYLICYNDIAEFFHLSTTLRDSDPMIVAYLAMILSTACRLSESFRSAYKAIDPVQFAAGYSIGLTKLQTLKRIIVPQLIPVVMSTLTNNLVGTIKNSNLIAAIGLNEVMNGALESCMDTYSFLEGYVAAAVIYWTVSIILEQAGKYVEKRSSRFRRQIA